MKRKGIQFKPAYHLTFRGVESTDTYIDGTPIESPYIVIESLKTGKQIPVSYHSRTNMVYGKVRNKKNRPYKTKPVYWAEDGRVFQGTIRITE